MKKTFTFWKSLFLLCALIVGSSSAWADEQTFTPGTDTGETSVTKGAVTATMTTMNNVSYYQIYAGQSGTFTCSGGNITKIEFTCTASGTSKYGPGNASANVGSYSYSGSTGTWSGNANSVTISTTAQIRMLVLKITYNVTPSHTITAQSNNDSYGTVSLDGSTITASPEEGYRVIAGDGGYTVTSGTATVVNNGDNTFTVTPTSACTVRINFEAIPTYTVSFNAEGGSCATTSLTESIGGGGVTLPTATCSKSGWAFAGWATAAVSESTTTRPTLYAAGETFYPTANTNLYAVYSVEGVGSSQYKRAASVDEVTSASSVAIVTNNDSYILNHELTNAVSAPAESEGKITVSDNYVFSLSGNNTDGFTISSTGGKKVGPEGTPTSSSKTKVLYITTDITTKWIVEKYNNNEDIFVLRIAESDHAVMQYFSEDWKSYYATNYSTDEDGAMKIYVPEICYNSNPTSDIIEPSVAFEKGNTTLYLDGTTTYTNAASVTGVDKSVTGYKSSDESVATVDASGVVTAVGIGTATITAYLDIELGEHKAAEASYEVTVKNTTTIAGLKALYNAAQSPAKAFAADFTDAVVTYVSGNHAYIQDASGAIYASCGSSLTAGKKINGAVSGTITAPNQIDEIKTIDLSKATLTDTDVPAAEVKTLAQIKAGDYDGKLVTVNGATIKTGMNDATSGGVITDDNNQTTFNIIAPNRLTLNATEEGNFTAFVSIYGGSTYRLNIYEASQFVKTRNVATAQPLAFTENAIELDEETTAFAEFTGQAVEGAQGTVTYAITGDAIGTVNAETGVVTLNGACGTATITATAAAKDVTVAGVTTPYTETEESYTVTVNPRYTVIFSINGKENPVRQATYGAAVDVPTVEFLGSKVFVGWGNASDATATVEMGATYTPAADKTFYALFATETVGEDVVEEYYKNTGATGTNATSGVTASGNINSTSSNGNPAPSFGLTSSTNKTATFTEINLSAYKSATIKMDYKLNYSGGNYTSLTVKQYNSSNQEIDSDNITGSSTSYATSSEIALDLNCTKITITCNPTNNQYNSFVDNIIITGTKAGIAYEDYTSNVGTTNVIIDGNAESIDLSAMNDITALVGVHADEITYTRTMKQLSSIYLPYDSEVPAGMTAYEFVNQESATKLNFTEVTDSKLKAYTPYVLAQSETAARSLTGSNVTIVADTDGHTTAGDWTFKGTAFSMTNAEVLAEAAAVSGTAYIINSGKWYPVPENDVVTIPAFRAYFICSTSGSGAKVMDMSLNSETTAINGVEEITPVTKTRKVVKNGRIVIETANGEFTIDGARVK